MDLFRITEIYTGEPLLPQVAAASQGLTLPDAESFVGKAVRSRGISSEGFRLTGNDTLLVIRHKLAVLDYIAGTALHAPTIGEIDAVYNRTATSLSERTGLDQTSALERLHRVSNCLRLDPLEAEAYVRNAPHVEGFDRATDTSMSNETVKSYLDNTFGLSLLRKAQIWGVDKINNYLVNFKAYAGTERGPIIDEARRRGLLNDTVRDLFAPPTLQAYQQLEALFEGSNPQDIKHTFRNRALDGVGNWVQPMVIANHSIEDMQSFDYFEDLAGLTDQQLRDIYILGSIAHEVGHELQPVLEPDYQTIVETELAPSGVRGVSGYAREYTASLRDEHTRSEQLFVEDHSEALRIFVSNAGWLRVNFPMRYTYIRDKYPSIVPNGALQTVLAS